MAPQVRGGARGVVRGFSPASRARLMRLLARVDWRSVAAPHEKAARARAFFVSLTFGEPPAPQFARARLLAWRERFRRAWGPCGVIWRQEWQERGAVHFHLVVFFDELQEWRPFRDWVVSNWLELVPGSGAGGQDVRAVWGSGARLMVYLGKYMSKVDNQLAPAGSGRAWGVWYPERVPFGEVGQVNLSPAQTREVIRRIRAYGREVGSPFLAELRSLQGALVYGEPFDLARFLVDLPEE